MQRNTTTHDGRGSGRVAVGVGAWQRRLGWVLGMTLGLLGAGPAARPADVTPEGIEFFEKRIRPLLVNACYKCHSATAEKLKGSLRLDSREGLLKGGETRPAIAPGHPEQSLLIEAVRYGNPDLQMPPKNRLEPAQVADLTDWVRMGAPWPHETSIVTTAPKKPAFDLEQRRQEHWCWRPIQATARPSVRQRSWPLRPVDEFVLARLEREGLAPAPSANKAALLRRVYFDLTGLPPTLSEIAAYEKDAASDAEAWGRVVDRLLASPRYGERWARHWLDLVRYSETLGHEFDYTNPNAWRYRDYVIRALNEDVPYRQFAMEQIAGDLLAAPRRRPVTGLNESIIGPAFYWLGQRDHSPVDVRLHQAEVIDNQVDVLSKTFLGLTVACARCHDHKFDAISTQDYYALFGVLGSSRYAQRSLESNDAVTSAVQRLEAIKTEMRAALADCWKRSAGEAGEYLAANQRARAGGRPADAGPGPAREPDRDRDRDRVLKPKWASALQERWTKAAAAWPTAWASAKPGLGSSNDVELADFPRRGYDGWFVEGQAFGSQPARPGDFMVGSESHPVAGLVRESSAHGGLIAGRLQGTLRSATFPINRRYLHVLAAGREARMNVPVDNFTMIRDPIYGTLKQVFNRDEPGWIRVDLEMWKGHRAYVEFSDVSTPDPSDDGHKNGFAPDGWLAVSRVLLSDAGSPPAELEPGPKLTGELVRSLVSAWCDGHADPRQLTQLDWLVRRQLLDPDNIFAPASASAPAAATGSSRAAAWFRLATLVRAFHEVERTLPEPRRVPSMVEGTPIDEAVFVRGNHRTPGPIVPRRFLEALDPGGRHAFQEGSGRLELARQVTDPGNPLFARVIVNRVWLHLFGRGLVPTPDDFGALGQPPTHPELLDWLANWFRTDGDWQLKKLIRLLATSRAYQMSSRPDDALAEERDPSNTLWHRAEVRRLEGEAIRDAILALSGRLDETMFGPPIPIHLTEFMEGRGRPPTSGPLDGAGRRSVYVEVRRNFVSPMMRAFDTPVPYSTVGRRTVSNVPAQSLILLNDPFVVEQARVWASRLLKERGHGQPDLVRELYLATFGRRPTASELAQANAFVQAQGARYRESDLGSAPAATEPKTAEEAAWADLCHVLLNVKEFVFVN